MSCHIHITKTAEHDLNDAADYIEFTLKNPTAADELLNLAEARISKLSAFPEVHSIVDDPVLSAWGVCFITVSNYLAFYIISGNTIYIIRFLYGKRDWISILKNGFSFN